MRVGTAAGLQQPVALAQANLAAVLVWTGAAAEAVPMLAAAAESFRSAADLYSLQIARTLESVAAWQLGKPEHAVDALTEALDVMEAQGSREWQSLTIGVAASLVVTLSDAGKAAPLIAWLDSIDPHWVDTVRAAGIDAAIDHRVALMVPATDRPDSASSAARRAHDIVIELRG
jgi:hypothetical protein